MTWIATAISNACRTMSIPRRGIADATLLLRLCAARDRQNAQTRLEASVAAHQNYALDIVSLRFGKVDDGVMRYS